MSLPRMIRVRQIFEAPVVDSIPEAIAIELENIETRQVIKSGENVAVTAGSRGIAHIDQIIKAICLELKKLGARPFIVPAMGSHGGATAQGQIEVLKHYGITEESMQVAIKSSMEVVEVGRTDQGLPVYMDQNAYHADHIIVVGRIKPHTDFNGAVESGLMKMMAIGLGKQIGANMYHKAFFKYGFERVIRNVAKVVLKNCKIAFGVGILENAYDQTAKIAAIRPAELEIVEEKLQAEAKKLMAHLPFDELDLLIVDKMGKDISGAGMDTNIIGRMMQNFEPEPEKPSILRIFVRDLTDNSYGNACGLGLADFTTTRLVQKIDFLATKANAITALAPQKCRIPLYYDTDLEAIQTALNTIGLIEPEQSRVARIKNTLQLGEVLISEALLEAASRRKDLEIIGQLQEMEFDEHRNLKPL